MESLAESGLSTAESGQSTKREGAVGAAPEGRTSESGQNEGVRFGLVLGAIASLPLLAILISQWSRGWSPVGDDAVIALRSFDVFTSHMPVVGQFSQASGSGPVVYDPGPLLYWALAIPVRLFATGGGALLGATVIGVGALTVAIVAAQRAAGRAVAAVVTVGALIAVWSAGPPFALPVWNPFAALIPFVAAAMCGWAVATGSLRWWPAVVVFASFSMQAHLMYAPAGIAIVVLAPILGVLARRRIGSAVGKRWAVTGGIVGLICWSAPVLQELTHRPGNLTMLWRNSFSGSHRGLGITYALNNLARGVAPNPAWLHETSLKKTSAISVLTLHGRGLWGIAALVALATIVVAAAVRRDERVLGLSALALVTDLGAIWVVAKFPTGPDQLLAITYVSWLFWPAGMLTWFTYGYTVVRWGRRALAGVSESRPRGVWGLYGAGISSYTKPNSRWSRIGPPAAMCVLLAVSVALSVVVGATVDSRTTSDTYAWQSTGPAAQRIAKIITARDDLRHCRIRLENTDSFALLGAITYQLAIRDRHAAPASLASHLQPYYKSRPGDPAIAVTDTLKARVPPRSTRLGVVGVRDPDGTPHRYTISLTTGSQATC